MMYYVRVLLSGAITIAAVLGFVYGLAWLLTYYSTAAGIGIAVGCYLFLSYVVGVMLITKRGGIE